MSKSGIIIACTIRGGQTSAGSDYLFRGCLPMPYLWVAPECRMDDFNDGG
jgi:hypothetical protein